MVNLRRIFFKIATRHCCGKKFFRLYGSFSLHPLSLSCVPTTPWFVLVPHFRSLLPASSLSTRSWALGCLRVRADLGEERGEGSHEIDIRDRLRMAMIVRAINRIFI